MTHEEMKQVIAERWEALHFEIAMAALGRHLVVAAALCLAFYRGFDEGFAISGEGFNGEYMTPRARTANVNYAQQPAQVDYEWRPGCGRSIR